MGRYFSRNFWQFYRWEHSWAIQIYIKKSLFLRKVKKSLYFSRICAGLGLKGLIYKKTIFVNVFVSNITFNFCENRLVKFFNYLSDVIPASFPVQIPRCRFLLNVPIENVSDKRAIVLQDIIMIGFDLTSHWLRNAKSKTKSDDPHFRFDWALPFQTLTETSCQLERQMAKTMDDAFVPECKTDGDYADVQCFEHEGFAKQCWCVTKDGQEIKDTRTSDGLKPDCRLLSLLRK